MDEKNLQELSEVVQSSNINFLFGAGTSTPFLPLLGNIEKRLNEATNNSEKEVQYKEYLTKVMLPNKKVIRRELSSDANYLETNAAYQDFFRGIIDVLIRRKNTILSKQVNLFTSNIDVLMETCLEELKIEYNDGFYGKFSPVFGLANFKKSIYQRSLHFEHVTELPVVNIIKIHGSLTWQAEASNDKILFSGNLDHIDDVLGAKTGNEFDNSYKKILVVNPQQSKHLESVLNLYYSELLRLYSAELEKENSTLFILGFSMEDTHIREITLRSAHSNPTLRIFICCSKTSKDTMFKKMAIEQHPNIQILTPESDTEKFKLSYFNEHILRKFTLKKSADKTPK